MKQSVQEAGESVANNRLKLYKEHWISFFHNIVKKVSNQKNKETNLRLKKEKLMENTKHVADAAAGLGTLAAFAGWLPAIAAAFSIAWYCIRFYEWYKSKRVIE